MRQITFLLGLLALTAAGCGGGAGAGMPTTLAAPGGGGNDAAAAEMRPLVQGRIVFTSEEQVSLSDAVVDIHLVDSGGSGYPARLVAGQRLHDVAYQEADDTTVGKGLPFEIRGRKADPNGAYFVSVRIDADGDGKMGSGDYLSQDTRLQTTDLSQGPDQVTVAVEKVP